MHFYIDKYNRLKVDHYGKDPKPTAEQEAFSAKARTYREAFSEHEFQHDLEDENEEMEWLQGTEFRATTPKKLRKKIKMEAPILNVNESVGTITEYHEAFTKAYTKPPPPLKHTTIAIHKNGCVVMPEPVQQQQQRQRQQQQQQQQQKKKQEWMAFQNEMMKKEGGGKKQSDILKVSTMPVMMNTQEEENYLLQEATTTTTQQQIGVREEDMMMRASDPGPMVLSSLRSNACIKIHDESHVVIWRAQKILVVSFPELPKAKEATFTLSYRKPTDVSTWNPSSYNNTFCSAKNIVPFGEKHLAYKLMGKMVPRKMCNQVRMNNIFYKLTMNYTFENQDPVEAAIIFKIDNNKTYQKNILKLKRVTIQGTMMQFEPAIVPVPHDPHAHCSIDRIETSGGEGSIMSETLTRIKREPHSPSLLLTSPLASSSKAVFERGETNTLFDTPKHANLLDQFETMNDLYEGDLYHQADMSDFYNFQEENEPGQHVDQLFF